MLFRFSTIVVLFAALSAAPALAEKKPNFLASDFYGMLSLKPDASRAEIKAALEYAKMHPGTSSWWVKPIHKAILESAEDVLLSEMGRREAYDALIAIPEAKQLTLADQMSYMRGANERFNAMARPRGVSTEELHLRALVEYESSKPIGSEPSRYVGKSHSIGRLGCDLLLKALIAGVGSAGAAVGSYYVFPGFQKFVDNSFGSGSPKEAPAPGTTGNAKPPAKPDDPPSSESKPDAIVNNGASGKPAPAPATTTERQEPNRPGVVAGPGKTPSDTTKPPVTKPPAPIAPVVPNPFDTVKPKK